MVVLDTDVVSDLMRPKPSPTLVARLAEVAASEQSTTAVTLGELAYAANRAQRPELYTQAMRLLKGTRVFPFDRDAAECYGRIRCELEHDGTRLADPDLRIAAIVLAHCATLISGNVRHFGRISGLSVQNWMRG